MIRTKNGPNTLAVRLFGIGMVSLALFSIAGCGGAEEQKTPVPQAKNQVPGGGDPKEYEKKMQEIMGQQKAGTGTPAPK